MAIDLDLIGIRNRKGHFTLNESDQALVNTHKKLWVWVSIPSFGSCPQKSMGKGIGLVTIVPTPPHHTIFIFL